MKKSALVILYLMLAATLSTAFGQEPDKRHVTPVTPETNRVLPPPKGIPEEVIQHYVNGDSAAAALQARDDSLRRVYTHYPLLTDLAIGINFVEPVFMAFGQSYASADVNVTLNMWNRLQPTLEMGLGWAKSTPDDMNFTYRGKPSPYFKLGANYNFTFKSVPDYQIYLGVRLGYSTFSYDVTDVHYSNSYWGEDILFDIKGERSHALWGEAGAGIKVRLAGPLSMGWMVRWHSLFNYGKREHSRPWFIPGYGPRNGSLGFSLSLYYTLPLHRGARSTKQATGSQPVLN